MKFKKYSFEQIATNSTSKKVPEASDKDFYIGLEHIEPDCFEIKRPQSTLLPTGEKLIIKKGDVLFGKRRAYQRKVAIAPFDGIFSAHGFVFRPNTEIISPEYFPFFIRSKQFLDRAIKISVGGLSPTINWKDLKEQEFDLPSLADQKKLADKLWAAYRLKESYKKLLASMDELANARFVDMFLNRNLPTRKLRDLLADSFPGEWGCDDKTRTGTMVIRTTNFLNDGTLDLSNVVTRNIPENKVNKKSLNKGDIILERSGGTPNNPVGRVVYFNNEGTFLTNNFTQTLRCGEDLNSLYLFYYLYNFYKSDVNFFRRISSQTTGIQNLNMKYYMNIDVVVPNKDQQELFVLFLMQLDKSKSELKKSIAAIDDVMKSLIN